MYIRVADCRESMKSSNPSSEGSSTQTNPQQPVVITRGEATVKKAPDQAWLSIATETRDAKADDARRKNAETMTAVQANINTLGLSGNAIRTTSYSLAPEIEWKNGRGTVKGYIVHNQIEIRVDDLDRLSDVIDAV